MEFGGQEKLRALKGGGTLGQVDGRFLLAGRCGIYMSLGCAMACARVLENGAPFGMAMAACSGAGVSGVFALAGAALGYLISGGRVGYTLHSGGGAGVYHFLCVP